MENLFEDFEIVPVDESKLDSSLAEKLTEDTQDGPAMDLDSFAAWLTTL